MLYVPATTTIINLMDIQDQGVDYYLGDMTLASCRPEFQYMFKISKVIGKDGRLKKLRQRKCIADSAIENGKKVSKS